MEGPAAVLGHEYKTQPFGHQIEMTEFMLRNRSGAVLCEQGTGKTKATIDFFDQDAGSHYLVVCPKTVMTVWREEVEKHSARYSRDDVYLLTPPTARRVRALEPWRPGIYVINYEGVRALRDKHGLHRLEWDAVVADESTRMKTPTAMLSRAMHEFSSPGCDCKRFILTGMPVTQSPLDYWSQFRFVDRSVFADRFFRFKYHFSVVEPKWYGGRQVNEVVGHKNLDELKARVARRAVQFRKEDCLDLPPKIYQRRVVSLPRDQRKAYDQFREQLILEIGSGAVTAANVLAQLTKLRQLSGGWVSDSNGEIADISKKGKLEELRSVVDEVGPGFIVWASFHHDVQRIVDSIGADYRLAKVTGRESGEERAEAVRMFQCGEVDGIVAIPACAKFGLTMHRAHTAIYYSQSFSVDERCQSEDRCHRVGLEHPVSYIDLIAEGTVDEHVSMLMEMKKAVALDVSSVREILS